jgi:hypothetical protein
MHSKRKAGNDNGSFDIFVSLALAARCNGLVGNSASSMYELVHAWMCVANRRCPLRWSSDERLDSKAIEKLKALHESGCKAAGGHGCTPEIIFAELVRLRNEPGYKRDIAGGYVQAGKAWEDPGTVFEANDFR